jgi:hypothetical protein
MKTWFKYAVILNLLAGWVSACQKKEEYPIIPQIEYEGMIKLFNSNLNLYDRGVLRISFKDGDGDIGLRDGENLPPYDYNFFVKYYELHNGEEVRVVIADTNEFNARIPILTPAGSIKAIKGEIEDTLFIYNFQSQFDTIKFDAYLVDRALHKSNTITTGWFLRN